ncbi:MAG: hypothetical protein Q7V10_08440 [Methanobacteriaceae archaeon]|nr:hypothetical protein [Methanobacteriaceae archaeon]MDO9627074.1 hypothetical protein [Methanobacteriaceae archaeon]
MVSKKFSASTKRQIRKEAGYGCCRCGSEIIQYHHINPNFNKVEDGMALCPGCHDMATRGAMTLYEQLEFKNNPYNIVHGYSKGKLIINPGTIPFLFIGHNTISPSENIITVNGESLLGININDDGFIALSLKLYNENDDLVMEILDNEWISGDFLAWDIEVSYKWIKIRPKKRKIILDIRIDGIIKIKADLWRRGSNIKLSPEKLEIIGNDGNIKFSTDHFCGVLLENFGFNINENGEFFLG